MGLLRRPTTGGIIKTVIGPALRTGRSFAASQTANMRLSAIRHLAKKCCATHQSSDEGGSSIGLAWHALELSGLPRLGRGGLGKGWRRWVEDGGQRVPAGGSIDDHGAEAPQERDQAAILRDERAELDDELAASRDWWATRRDQAAEARDQAADRRPRPEDPARMAGWEQAVIHREIASSERQLATADRREAAQDRQKALAERQEAVPERVRAVEDRSLSAQDRAAAARERAAAALERARRVQDRATRVQDRARRAKNRLAGHSWAHSGIGDVAAGGPAFQGQVDKAAGDRGLEHDHIQRHLPQPCHPLLVAWLVSPVGRAASGRRCRQAGSRPAHSVTARAPTAGTSPRLPVSGSLPAQQPICRPTRRRLEAKSRAYSGGCSSCLPRASSGWRRQPGPHFLVLPALACWSTRDPRRPTCLAC